MISEQHENPGNICASGSVLYKAGRLFRATALRNLGTFLNRFSRMLLKKFVKHISIYQRNYILWFYNGKPCFLKWKPVFPLQFLSQAHCNVSIVDLCRHLSLLVKWTVYCLSGLTDSVITNIVFAAVEKCQVPYLCLNLLNASLRTRYLHFVVKQNYFGFKNIIFFRHDCNFHYFVFTFLTHFWICQLPFHHWKWNKTEDGVYILCTQGEFR